MTKDILITYGDLQGEVRDLQERVDKVTRQIKDMEEGNHIVTDIVTMGKRGKKPLGLAKVTGFPVPLYSKKLSKLGEYKIKLELKEAELLETLNQVEEFIQGIENPSIRSILRYRCIDNMSWTQIGHELGRPADTCRMELNRFFEKL